MKQIIVGKNRAIAFVDDNDYELASKYGWFYRRSSLVEYAVTYSVFNGTKRWFYLHQLIMGTIDSKNKVDHKNRNGLDNQRCNLRIACHSDNMKNRRKHRGTSNYTGVSLHFGQWLSRININGKQKYLGWFKSEIEAAKAYNTAAIETGNIFYNLNEL
jgi:hypothetical protein